MTQAGLTLGPPLLTLAALSLRLLVRSVHIEIHVRITPERR